MGTKFQLSNMNKISSRNMLYDIVPMLTIMYYALKFLLGGEI